MNILKVLLVVLITVISTIAVLAVIGLAANLLFYLFWLAVICLVLIALAKLFGSKGDGSESASTPQSRLQDAELTLDEYRRKLEAEVKPSGEKQL